MRDAEVVVTGEYEVGMQDQAFLGPESGLAVPDGEGGVDLYIATQWLHVDRDQLALSLDLPPEKVRLTMSGVGGAFGGREDLSMQIHACMLALHTGRPVRMVYNREESFFGHVHRHPCRMRYEHGATARRAARVRARADRARRRRLCLELDGRVLERGVLRRRAVRRPQRADRLVRDLHQQPAVRRDARVRRRPGRGRARGADGQARRGARASTRCELRIANAMRPGSRLPTGQVIREPAPVAELLERVRAMPLPPAPADGGRDLRELPGGVSNTTHGEGVRRGVGYAVGIKNVGFSEGFDDYSTARVRLSVDGGEPLVEVHTAAVEVGQGLVTVQAQIARTELGVERVAVLTADTRVGSAGSSSASRQTYVTGGAVKAACEAVRERLGADPRTMTADELAELLGEDAIEETVEWHHRETYPLDENGQGDAHLQFAFSAHRAVVDVDVELGLVRVVELATAQEVGKAMNPQALEGQIQGGTAQGLGLALLEEIQIKDGRVLNASFTDYLLPTILDMPPMRIEILEHADPEAPYGLKGVGEPPHISTPPAVVAALRAASGRPLTRIPVRPEHIVGLEPEEPTELSLAELGALFEHSPWVAEAAWQRRPFGSVAELEAALEAAMREAPRERQLELIRAHPELAGREAQERTLTPESAGEQASAGLDRLTADELETLRRLNRSYRERFGFPLIVCVREHTKESIIAWGTARLEHSREQEIEIALGEIAKIARLRLADLLEESCLSGITTHVLDTSRGRPAAGRAGVARARRGFGLAAGRPRQDRRRRAGERSARLSARRRGATG